VVIEEVVVNCVIKLLVKFHGHISNGLQMITKIRPL